uniref:Uncharacterized protein n=1 Tax=Cacopsylla melanoneura TaxID=428564 RepID=A0A8D8VFH8_9HEMI
MKQDNAFFFGPTTWRGFLFRAELFIIIIHYSFTVVTRQTRNLEFAFASQSEAGEAANQKTIKHQNLVKPGYIFKPLAFETLSTRSAETLHNTLRIYPFNSQ